MSFGDAVAEERQHMAQEQKTLYTKRMEEWLDRLLPDDDLSVVGVPVRSWNTRAWTVNWRDHEVEVVGHFYGDGNPSGWDLWMTGWWTDEHVHDPLALRPALIRAFASVETTR